MGLFDRFRRSSGPSRGVRQGRRGERRPDERTESFARSPGPPAAPGPGSGAPPKTVVIPRGPQPGAPAPPPPMPSASPPPPPVASPGDAERTLYEPVRQASGRIVGVLVGVEGSLEGELVAIHDGESTLGRGESCRVRLRSQRISREHAKLVHQDGIFVIQSLSERNPTKVNGESTEGSELKHGDSLTLGDATFRFLSVN